MEMVEEEEKYEKGILREIMMMNLLLWMDCTTTFDQPRNERKWRSVVAMLLGDDDVCTVSRMRSHVQKSLRGHEWNVEGEKAQSVFENGWLRSWRAQDVAQKYSSTRVGGSAWRCD